jgi:hypothetical protein
MSNIVAEHDAIRTEYAAYTGATRDIQDTIASLQNIRPPTSPRGDIKKERESILAIVARNLRMVQIALLTVLVCLLEYLVFPTKYAHGIALLTMAVGIASGIYLSDI